MLEKGSLRSVPMSDFAELETDHMNASGQTGLSDLLRWSRGLVLFAGTTLVSGCVSIPSLTADDAPQTTQTAEIDPGGFGAIAFSNSTQRWHIRWDVSDQARADDLAVQYCGAGDCRVVLRFGPGQCGTFSLGNEGALGVGLGQSTSLAESQARADCSASGQSCKVAPVRCNGES